MANWEPLPLDKPLFANLDESAVVGFQTAIENAFQNELGGINRFPGLIERIDFGNNDRVYLHDFEGDLVAATSHGQLYRIDRAFNYTNVTGVPIAGGRRPVFAKSDRELMVAAGGPIVRLREARTEVLSTAAPSASLIAWLDNITIAVEINSGRFFHSGAGTPDQWDPLDTFAADGTPDNINSLIVTPFAELILGGEESTEQFERLSTGDAPFFRRWSAGTGVKLSDAMLFADNAVWTINNLRELVRFSGRITSVASEQIGLLLEQIDDWTDAWIGGYPDRPLHILGQKFMVFQAPNATNPYGTKGLTLLHDYRQKRFYTLYGWDAATGTPTRWPGWSHWTLWDKVFVGGEGKIYELSDTTYRNGSDLQRWLIRTSHLAVGDGASIDRFRLQLTRGIGSSNDAASQIRVRCSRDARPFGPWITRDLGRAGDTIQVKEFGCFGNGNSFQWEIECTDDCKLNLIKAEIQATPLGR